MLDTHRRGISPLLGVTLLVGIVVALSAIAAAMMLSVTGSPSSGPPEASFDFEESSDGLVLRHAGGEEIDPAELYFINDSRVSVSELVSGDSLSAGDRIGPVDPNGVSEVRLVWEGDEDSHTVSTFDSYETLDFSTTILDNDQTVVYGSEALAGDGGRTTTVAPRDADVLGPPDADLTGNGTTDLPYIDSSGNLKITDSDGRTDTLVSSSDAASPSTSKAVLGVGSWDGSGPSVFYPDGDQSSIYRVDDQGSPTTVATPASGVSGVVGIGDIDGDSTDELLFVDGSQQTRYLEPDGTITELDNGGTGQNDGVGVGKPPDFDGDGTVRVAIVDGSNQVKIVGEAESTITFNSTSAAKSPVTAVDVDDDDSLEIVYLNTNSKLRYVDDPLSDTPTIEVLTDETGSELSGSDSLGVVS